MTALLVIGYCQYATVEEESDHTLVWSGYGGGLYYAALRRFNLSLLTILLTLDPVMRIVRPLLLYGKRPSLQGLVGGTAVILGVLLVTISRQRKGRV